MRLLFLLMSFWVAVTQAQNTPITLDAIWTQGAFYPKRMYNLHALQHAPQYTVLEYNQEKGSQQITLYDFATLSKVKDLFVAKDFGIQRIADYAFSADEKYLIIGTNRKNIYRHSFVANYYLFNIETNEIQRISDKSISVPTLSPNGKTVAFAFENNLYLYDLATGKETKITTDGKKNEIINGTADWVYEEEFSIVRLFDWNADGTCLAFVRSDERKVPEFSMDVYGNELYPTRSVFKYPKAGENNSAVSLHLYHLNNGQTTTVPLEAYYIPRVQFSKNPQLLMVQTLNRHQNNWQFLQINIDNLQTTPLVKETSKTYVEVNENIQFLADNSFVFQSEKDGYNHLYHCTPQGKVQPITNGNWEVTNFYGYDAKTKQIFYQSTEKGSINRAIYAIGLNGKNKRLLSPEIGTNNATFSGDFSHYILSFSNATTPPRYALHLSKNAKEVKEILNNKPFLASLQKYNLPTKEFFEIKTAEGALNAFMIKPKDFDPNKKYPVLMYQYSGPGSQQVANKWWSMDDFWHSMLTQKGYIVACVDGRGTGFKGANFKKCTYLELGKKEVEDQAEAAKIIGNYPYVDKNRIGIWGWSFGGFMASNCLFQKGEVFKMSIAVAPVTNWRFYDTVYTERFMRTPQENPNGYDDNSPISHAAKLKGKFLLVHGTADDNVHVQNAMVLIDALVSYQKNFDWLIYPDKDHGIYDNTGSTRKQLYLKMTQFIEENL